MNAVIGDQSFVTAFGRLPDERDDNILRIQTHLRHVIQRLKQHIPASVSPADYPRRQFMVALLENYANAGRFPQQFEYAGRRPLFEDAQGNVCAVGYLVQQTAGQELVNEIREDWGYDYLPEIEHPILLAWAEQSGLTQRELAMIQPTYGWRDPGQIAPEEPVLEDPAFGPFLYTMHGAQTLLLGAHIFAFQLEPAEYKTYRTLDILLTLGIPLVSLITLGIDDSNSSGYENSDKSIHLSAIFGLFAVNFLSLLGIHLKNNIQENKDLNVGTIPVAYGQATGISYQIRF